MKRTTLSAAVGSALLTLGHMAAAQAVAPASADPTVVPATVVNTPTATVSGFEAPGIPMTGLYAPVGFRIRDSGIFVTPTLGISVGHNDNLRITSSNPRSSNFLGLNPQIVASGAYRADRYTLGYQADIVRYSASSQDDVENQELAATGVNVLGTRTSVSWRAAFLDRYDPIGSTLRSSGGGVTQPDHWQAVNLGAAARFGAPGARGRAEVEVGLFDKEFQNNRASTATADNRSTNFATRLYARVAPATEVLAEYRNTRFDYDIDTTNLDNTEHRVLVGVQWQATAKTAGIFKVGHLSKRFERGRTNFSGGTWEGGIRWQPRTYSTVDLSTGRAASDPSGAGTNFVLASMVNAAWTHRWKTFFSTRVSFAHLNERYDGLGRRDKTDTLSVGAAYDVRRNARASVGVDRTVRNSNVNSFDYHRNLITAKLELAF